jgi:hemolysin III
MTDLPRELAPSQIRTSSGGAIEEIFNSITHAIGAGLSIAGLVALLVLTGDDPSPWKYVSFSIYGASQILLFLSSAIMHSFAAMPRVRRVLSVFDRIFIYVLIAGTYTPVCLIALRDTVGWTIFGIIWGLAAVGIIMKTVVIREDKLWTDLLYVPMGWLVAFVFRPVLESTPPGFVLWLVIGAICYTAGVGFFAWRKLPYSHVVWHLLVIGGSISFFMGFALHLA